MKALTNRPHRHCRRIARRSEQGQSFLEFALVVPFLFLMLIGVAFISQGFNLQMALYGAAYEGARVWAKNPAGGDNNHCTPPACNPNDGNSINFEKYVIPVVRQYLTNNGYDGAKVFFFADNLRGYRNALDVVSNNTQTVSVTLLYPYDLPVGALVREDGKNNDTPFGFQRVLISATCVMKRGG